MNLKSLWIGLGLILFINQPLTANDIDKELERWLKSKDPINSLTTSTKDVVVFIKRARFVNRSGMMRSMAIAQEQEYSQNYLATKETEINASLTEESQVLDNLWASSALFIRVDRASLRKLKKRKDIDTIIANKIITLDTPMIGTKDPQDEGQTYGLKLINAPKAWERGIRGEGTVVGILDSGIDTDHPELEGKVLAFKDFTKDNSIEDRNGHGTHVAGTIAGGNANGINIGVAPDSKLVIAKIFDDRGSSSFAVILKAMQWIMDPDGDPSTPDAPRVVSNSWGSGSQFVLGFRNIVSSWRRFNIFPSFAAGNSGPRWMSTGAPGRYPVAYAVGAVDSDSVVTRFSSRGPSLWLKAWGTRNEEDLNWFQKYLPRLYKKPDIMAPGLNVFSSLPDGKYGSYSGTSMATPHVTGVISLALQANPSLSVADLEEILNATAMEMGKPGHDNDYGNGLIQADLVVERALLSARKAQNSFVDENPENWGF